MLKCYYVKMIFMLSEIKQFFKDNEADIILVVGVMLIASISFGGGWLLGNKQNTFQTSQNEIKIEEISPEKLKAEAVNNSGQEESDIAGNSDSIADEKDENQSEDKEIVASKNGDVYHYIWCSGAKRINEENKIYFSSKAEAEAAGYRPAQNCPGLTE